MTFPGVGDNELPRPVWGDAPRYCPDLLLPTRAYLPGCGMAVHHSSRLFLHEMASRIAEFEEPVSVRYRYGIDLYHQGFLWESHEMWEALWQAERRDGLLADFYQALILNSAAQWKQREGRLRGVSRLSMKSYRLFKRVQEVAGSNIVQDMMLPPVIDAMRHHYGPMWERVEPVLDAASAPRLVLV